jgi:C1A family cysteine protease
MGSRLFQYYNERVIENNIKEDNGATVADSIKAVQNYGMCIENDWPYIISKFAIKPPVSCYTSALKHRAIKIYNIPQNLIAMQTILSQNIPIILGITVYKSFESTQVANTGIVPMPPSGRNDYILGGHCIVIVGYNKLYWICRNSWGTKWGINGYFYLPLTYLTNKNLCSDLWSIESDTN